MSDKFQFVILLGSKQPLIKGEQTGHPFDQLRRLLPASEAVLRRHRNGKGFLLGQKIVDSDAKERRELSVCLFCAGKRNPILLSGDHASVDPRRNRHLLLRHFLLLSFAPEPLSECHVGIHFCCQCLAAFHRPRRLEKAPLLRIVYPALRILSSGKDKSRRGAFDTDS